MGYGMLSSFGGWHENYDKMSEELLTNKFWKKVHKLAFKFHKFVQLFVREYKTSSQ